MSVFRFRKNYLLYINYNAFLQERYQTQYNKNKKIIVVQYKLQIIEFFQNLRFYPSRFVKKLFKRLIYSSKYRLFTNYFLSSEPNPWL